MEREQLGHIYDLENQRSEALYRWLRHLLLTASGSLTVLVSLNSGAHSTGMALWFLRATWVLAGLGILTGSVALYGEVHMARRLAAKTREEYIRAGRQGRAPDPAEMVVAPAIWMRAAEAICYATLAGGVIALVGYALARTE